MTNGRPSVVTSPSSVRTLGQETCAGTHQVCILQLAGYTSDESPETQVKTQQHYQNTRTNRIKRELLPHLYDTSELPTRVT